MRPEAYHRSFADSADKSLSINTDEKRELSLSLLLLLKTQSESIRDTKRTIIGRGRKGQDPSSLVAVRSSLSAALVKVAVVLFGFPILWMAWNIKFSGSAPSSFRTSITFLEHSTPLSPGFSRI